MRLGNVLRWAAAGAAAALVVASAALAGGQRPAAGATTIKAVQGPPKFQITRFVEDTLRWDKDVYKVKSGGTLHIVNLAADEGPHTFTVLAKKDEPRTLAKLFRCQICEKLAKAHG